MQMKKIVKKENGSMAVYVAIVLLSFLVLLSGIYMSSSSARKSQLITTLKIKQSYETDTEKIEEIYQKQFDKLEAQREME